ncbi:MAG TPA: lipoyl(octanoyl) transferase LipB [Chitinophagaceae bacterium]|nr:lipoyl(octanoyl) transferase LipB [Chitinophagaceae bacterium]
METPESQQEVTVLDLGLIGYRKAWEIQEQLLQENLRIKEQKRLDPQQFAGFSTNHYLIFCEHTPVYTLGKSGKAEHLLATPVQLRDRGIEFVETNRGGDITYHGPGQIVGYPILDLERFRPDIGYYLRSLEETIIRAIAPYGITGDRSSGETGVWLDPQDKAKARKICAMGVRCSRWITMHGFALNVNTDLSYFSGIIPCGISDKQVTSMEKELGRPVLLQEVRGRIRKAFGEVFGVRTEARQDLNRTSFLKI